MIPRYARPEMVAVWSEETRYRIWFEIEAHAGDAMAELGLIPRENAEAVWRARDARFDLERIAEIEAVTRHDVIAFLTHLAEIVGAREARFVHQGLTSSDVLDTALAVQLARATDILLADHRRAAGGAEGAGLRAPPDALRRPLPRHPRRAHDLRAEDGALPRGVPTRPPSA